MHTYTLDQTQWIDRPIDEVFRFFSDAKNLEAITPPWVGFKILSMSTPEIEQGTRIGYRIRVHGLPLSWLTEITEWNPPYHFADVQLRGPYSLWHHTHQFEAHGERTLMTDHVRYSLPFGPIGRIAHTLMVRRDVEQIFTHRRRAIDEYFQHTLR
jgi:hypothetical protein